MGEAGVAAGGGMFGRNAAPFGETGAFGPADAIGGEMAAGGADASPPAVIGEFAAASAGVGDEGVS
jgi:hypothetical protein